MRHNLRRKTFAVIYETMTCSNVAEQFRIFNWRKLRRQPVERGEIEDFTVRKENELHRLEPEKYIIMTGRKLVIDSL